MDGVQEPADRLSLVVRLCPEVVVVFGEPLAGVEDVWLQFFDRRGVAENGVDDLLGRLDEFRRTNLSPAERFACG